MIKIIVFLKSINEFLIFTVNKSVHLEDLKTVPNLNEDDDVLLSRSKTKRSDLIKVSVFFDLFKKLDWTTDEINRISLIK